MSTLELVNVVVGAALATGFLLICALKGYTRRYIYLNLHCACMLVSSAVRQITKHSYGLRSKEYFYAYFGSDLLLTVLLYLVILSFFEIILKDSPLRSKARVFFLVCFGIVAAVSYLSIANSISLNGRRYIVELQQNMYFTSVVLTVLLCMALAHLRVMDPQLRTLVFALGAYAGLQAAFYAFQNVLPKPIYAKSWEVIRYMMPLPTEIRLVLWCTALVRIPAVSQVLGPANESTRSGAESDGSSLLPALARTGGHA